MVSVFTSGYVNTETILHFTYKSFNEDSQQSPLHAFDRKLHHEIPPYFNIRGHL